MRRVLLSLTCAAALSVSACGDDSTPGNPTDTNPTDVTDTNQPDTDVTQPDTDATQPDTDATQPDTTDTNQPDTTPAPTRKCTDAELNTFNACADACPTGVGQDACVRACFDGLSNDCYNAYGAFQKCMQDFSCFDENGSADLECAAANCADEIDAVFGTPEPTDCNPVNQSGCEAGQICTVGDQQGNLYCVPPGDIPAFGDCTGDPSGCATGLCLGNQASAECLPFCNTTADCPTGGICGVRVDGIPYTFCMEVPACDLLNPQCASGTGCYVYESGPVCLPAGNKATGATCASVNECAPGNLCLGSGASGTCTKLCDTTADPSTCASGTTCQASPLDLGANVGVCAAPPAP